MEIHLGGGADGHFPQNYSSCRTKEKYVTKDKNTSFMGREGDVLPSSDMFLPSINMLEWNFIMGKSCSRGEMWGALLCFSKTTKQKINGWEWCFVLLAINLGSRWLMGVWFPGDNQPKTPDPNTPAKTSLHSNSTITLLIIPNITETKHHSLASSNSQIPTPFYIYRENPGSKSGGNTHGGEGGGEERWGVHGIRCCGFF